MIFKSKASDKKVFRKLKMKRAKLKKRTFAQAFAKARSEGKETFVWEGKTYTTKRADDK